MLQNLMLDDVEHPHLLEVELLQFLDVELLQLLTVELFQQLDDVELLQLQLQLLDVELPQLLEVVLCLVSGGLSVGCPIKQKDFSVFGLTFILVGFCIMISKT